jgi:hypothetical protein
MDHYKLVKLANYLIKIAFKLKPQNLALKKELIRLRGRQIVGRGRLAKYDTSTAKHYREMRQPEKNTNLVQQILFKLRQQRKATPSVTTPSVTTSSGSDFLPVVALGGLLGYVGLKASNKRKRK